MRKFLLPIFISLSLAACSEPVSVNTLPPPSFAQMSPIAMDVASIEVIDEYEPPLKAPNVEQFFATTPAEGVRIWARDRLRASGPARTLQVIIKDASVVESELPRTPGMKGAFTNDQSEKYDARLEVELRVYGDRALSDASVTAVATRTQTIAENASVADRERLFHSMLNDLLLAMNAEMEKNIYQYMGSYINYGQ